MSFYIHHERLILLKYQSDYLKLKSNRYTTFDFGDGASFEKGQLGLEQLTNIAKEIGEPEKISGKQELFESLVNQYLHWIILGYKIDRSLNNYRKFFSY